MTQAITLVAGATGQLGGRVVDQLLEDGKRVRALVRNRTDPAALVEKRVEIARGDLTDRSSLDQALDGVSNVVTTAAGYTRRRRGDSLKAVDDHGNRNLIDAAVDAGIQQFVFTSILACDQAPTVPHFWQKKLIEDYLEACGMPFVSLRPGAFIGGDDFWSRSLKNGSIWALGSSSASWSYVHIDEIARCLVSALDKPEAHGQRIDIAMERAISADEAAALFTTFLGQRIKVRTPPWWLIRGLMKTAGMFNPFLRDGASMIDFFLTGRYVADTRMQERLFGPVPTVEQTLREYASAAGLLDVRPEPAG